MKKISISLLLLITLFASACTAKEASAQTVKISFDREKGCTPETMQAHAGTFTIEAKNIGSSTGELEVIDGDRVRGEVENITPGQSRSFDVKLKEGEYELVCGKLKGKTGTLLLNKHSYWRSVRKL